MLLIRTFGRLASSREIVNNTLKSIGETSIRNNRYISGNTSESVSGSNSVDHNSTILTIKNSCFDRLKQILLNPQEEYLRIHIETGGCSGFSYLFEIEHEKNVDKIEDIIINRDDYKIVINRDFIPYLKGSSIEYKESLIKSSFHIENPLAETKCGCGTSFSINLNKLKKLY